MKDNRLAVRIMKGTLEEFEIHKVFSLNEPAANDEAAIDEVVALFKQKLKEILKID